MILENLKNFARYFPFSVTKLINSDKNVLLLKISILRLVEYNPRKSGIWKFFWDFQDLNFSSNIFDQFFTIFYRENVMRKEIASKILYII